METLDLEDFKYNQVNITAFRLGIVNCAKHTALLQSQLCSFRFVDAESIMVKDLLEEMEAFSPVGSNILNKTGVCCEYFMIYSNIFTKYC